MVPRARWPIPLTFETGRFGINEFAIGGDSAYVAYGAEDGDPVVVRLGLAGRKPQAEAPVISDIDSFDGFAVAGYVRSRPWTAPSRVCRSSPAGPAR